MELDKILSKKIEEFDRIEIRPIYLDEIMNEISLIFGN